MTPSDWNQRRLAAPPTGATAPATGARGTVHRIKKETKIIKFPDDHIHSKTRDRRFRAFRTHWTGPRAFLQAIWIMVTIRLADATWRWRQP